MSINVFTFENADHVPCIGIFEMGKSVGKILAEVNRDSFMEMAFISEEEKTFLVKTKIPLLALVADSEISFSLVNLFNRTCVISWKILTTKKMEYKYQIENLPCYAIVAVSHRVNGSFCYSEISDTLHDIFSERSQEAQIYTDMMQIRYRISQNLCMAQSNSPYALAIHISRASIDFFQRHLSAMGITPKRTKNSRKFKNISQHEDYIAP
jgi:hypothetical protein